MADSRSGSKKTRASPKGGGFAAGLARLASGLRRKIFSKPAPRAATIQKAIKPEPAAVAPASPPAVRPGWRTSRPELLERIWGAGWHLPLGKPLMEVMVAPFGLTKEMSVVDLSAGLGGMARRIAGEYKTYVTGLEPDPALAAYGAAQSLRQGMARNAPVDHYDPEIHEAERRYDCVLARELFFRIKDKPRFIGVVTGSLKSYGQVSWTDFIVEEPDLSLPAMEAWLGHEAGARPLSLNASQELWSGFGYDMRVSEDRTEAYKKDILQALARFVPFLKQQKLAEDVKPLIMGEIELWARRAAAFQAGMKFYRFYATKKTGA
ncbi:MAG: methyltransferase domain-containing protein [Alphaproteobacteria bacterium]